MTHVLASSLWKPVFRQGLSAPARDQEPEPLNTEVQTSIYTVNLVSVFYCSVSFWSCVTSGDFLFVSHFFLYFRVNWVIWIFVLGPPGKFSLSWRWVGAVPAGVCSLGSFPAILRGQGWVDEEPHAGVQEASNKKWVCCRVKGWSGSKCNLGSHGVSHTSPSGFTEELR